MIIENKPIDIKVDAQRSANYVSLMLFCYEVPSQKALTLSTIKRDLEIMKILEENVESESFELDDKYKNSLKETISSTPFNIRKKSLAEFGEYIELL